MTSFLWVSICVCFCQISQANHKIKTSGVTVARAVHDSFGGKQKKLFCTNVWLGLITMRREKETKWTDEQWKDLTRDWFWNTGIWMKAVATMQRQGRLGRGGQRYIIHAATYKVARWCNLKKGYSWEGESEGRIKKGERDKTQFP